MVTSTIRRGLGPDKVIVVSDVSASTGAPFTTLGVVYCVKIIALGKVLTFCGEIKSLFGRNCSFWEAQALVLGTNIARGLYPNASIDGYSDQQVPFWNKTVAAFVQENIPERTSIGWVYDRRELLHYYEMCHKEAKIRLVSKYTSFQHGATGAKFIEQNLHRIPERTKLWANLYGNRLSSQVKYQ